MIDANTLNTILLIGLLILLGVVLYFSLKIILEEQETAKW